MKLILVKNDNSFFQNHANIHKKKRTIRIIVLFCSRIMFFNKKHRCGSPESLEKEKKRAAGWQVKKDCRACGFRRYAAAAASQQKKRAPASGGASAACCGTHTLPSVRSHRRRPATRRRPAVAPAGSAHIRHARSTLEDAELINKMDDKITV